MRVLGGRDGQTVSVPFPYCVIGRSPSSSLVLDNPAVSSRHVYLHLDQRGLFAVDLATRTGTRIGPGGELSGWLQPGDRLEIANFTVEVVEIRRGLMDEVVGSSYRPPLTPLDDAGSAPLARLTLFPEDNPREPLSLNSELVFAGRSTACAVCVSSESAMRVQCALVRTPMAVYVVDLVGRGTWRNHHPVRGAERLLNGDSLMIGSTSFNCRILSPDTPRSSEQANLPALNLGVGSATVRPTAYPVPASESRGLSSFIPPQEILDKIPVEAHAQVLGWLMGQIQGRQDETNRQQAEFQTELVRLVAEIHRDNQDVLQRHLERADAIHNELAELRDEMKKRFGADAASHFPALSAPRPQPLRIAPVAPPEDPEGAANWLINRVNQLDQETRSSWKDLLGRLAGRKEG